MKSYCVKEKKQTECVNPCGYEKAKNRRWIFFWKCASCEITRTKVVTQGNKIIYFKRCPEEKSWSWQIFWQWGHERSKIAEKSNWLWFEKVGSITSQSWKRGIEWVVKKKYDQISSKKLTEKKSMADHWIFSKQLANYQNLNQDSPFLHKNTLRLTIHSTRECYMTKSLVK